MKFTTKEDIEAPIAWVFSQLSDFPAFERQAMRRGADVRRIDTLARPGIGSAWDVQFQFRGKDRQLRVEVTGFDAPNGLTVTATSPNLGGNIVADLLPLSRARTRVTIDMTITAHSLPSRLLLQSLKLAKGSLTRKFEAKMADYAREMQDRYGRQKG